MRPRLPDWRLILMPFIIGIIYILSMLSGFKDKHPDAKDHGFYVQGDLTPLVLVTLK
jgi:hypothetical protein